MVDNQVSDEIRSVLATVPPAYLLNFTIIIIHCVFNSVQWVPDTQSFFFLLILDSSPYAQLLNSAQQVPKTQSEPGVFSIPNLYPPTHHLFFLYFCIFQFEFNVKTLPGGDFH